MKIFNTLTRQKEDFVPLEPGKVKMYACGPTVYNFIHIGNARPICVFDTLRRYLEYKGYNVTFVQNFTDIDDKLINKAKEEGVTVKAVSYTHLDVYKRQSQHLSILQYNHGGNRHNAELLRQLRLLVDIYLTYLDLTLLLFGDLINNGREHPARTAPRRPEIQQNRLFG